MKIVQCPPAWSCNRAATTTPALFMVVALLTLLAAAVADTLNYTGSIVTWTVPNGVTVVRIEARGAQGGFNTNSTTSAGLGASMRGDFTVTPGSQLKILVGQQPNTSNGNGGGGGTFVTDSANNPLIIAGGGGGSSQGDDSTNKHGQTGTSGGQGAGGGGLGGTAGSGGSIGASGFQSGAGGGLLTDGANGFAINSGGLSFLNGGGGGTAQAPANGGFGGGGSGSSYVVGGGGGGYSGGGSGGNSTAGVGGGGGSYNGGTNQVNTGGANSGNGVVIIETTSETPSLIVNTTQDVVDAFDNLTSLSEAINFANSDGVDSAITFDATVFAAPRKTIMLGAEYIVLINGSLTITAPAAGVVLDGGAATRIFNFANTPVELSGLTMINGVAAGSTHGGAIIHSGSLTLTGCTISGNTSTMNGGGIASIAGNLTLRNSTVSNNSCVNGGGGIASLSGSTLTVDKSTISGNTAGGFGGGIVCVNSTVMLQNSTISGNQALGSNSGAGGGGIDTYAGSVITIRACTITGNSAPNVTGGARDGLWIEAGTVELRSSIVAGNSTQDIARAGSSSLVDGGDNLIGNNASVTAIYPAGQPSGSNWAGTAAAPLDPKLGPLQNNGGPTQTHALLFGSPAIDHGQNIVDLIGDQRNSARFVGSAPDIGAFEILTLHGISGYVRTNSLAPIAGASVQLGTATGPAGAPVTTDANGYYQVASVPSGAYFVTPTLAGWSFSPTTQGLLVSTAPRGANFIGTRIAANYTVSGRVSDASGIAMPGASVALTPAAGGVVSPVTTNGAGYFTFTNVPAGDYIITPTKAGTTFTPAPRNITVTSANITGQNFIGATGYQVSGRVQTSRGLAIAGASVQLDGGATVVSNGAGYYTFYNVADGNHNVVATLNGYTFTPSPKTVVVSGANVSGQNITGTPSP